MPRYYFTVHDGNWNEDPEGSTLDNDEAAHREALVIVHSLTKGRESDPKTYTIEVTEGDRLVWVIQWPPISHPAHFPTFLYPHGRPERGGAEGR
jgi:hypothetical protein